MFQKLLVANRGEIACRIIKTAKAMGLQTVAVYSDADAGSLHRQLADEAVAIGPSSARDSYLRVDKILEAARETGADAVHPGYGFLSENADFSKACTEAGLIFVGPRPETIEAMGSKAHAKEMMTAAGVPVLPGYQGTDQSIGVFRKEAQSIGYPVLIKAAAGGGGKGMRIVEREDDLNSNIETAAREAESAFGDGRLIIEKYLPTPRHVEVQVFGDSQGNIVHLFERDCSVQRRYQKVIEEAPAPDIPEATRAALHKAACDAARRVDYIGAGTVEFLYDPEIDKSGNAAGQSPFFFMEMNTRLQVEHPVTEMITGLDLVEWQLRVAAGEALPLTQAEITQSGHAIEARLYAEDPAQDYAPQTGRIYAFDFKEGKPGLRVDTGVGTGDEVTPFYDPMLAKVITSGETRTAAIERLADTLFSTEIDGVGTNHRQLLDVLHDRSFRSQVPTTVYLSQRHDLDGSRAPQDIDLIAAALWMLVGEDPEEASRLHQHLGFRLNALDVSTLVFEREGERVVVQLSANAGHVTATVADRSGPLTIVHDTDGSLNIQWMGQPVCLRKGYATQSGQRAIRLQIDDAVVEAQLFDPFKADDAASGSGNELASPMPATIVSVLVKEGDEVSRGQSLLTLEAMKMETVIRAPRDGKVAEMLCQPGDNVAQGDELIRLDEVS